MKKARISYAHFIALRKARQEAGTVAWIIERYIGDMNGTQQQPGIRPLGQSHYYALRLLQRSPVGPLVAEDLKRQNVIDLAKTLRETRQPSTVNQLVTYLGGTLKFAGSAWDDCEGVTAAAVDAAKPFLVKTGVISKGSPRSQRPTLEQNAALIAYFAAQNAHKRTRTDMVLVLRWQNASARRIGETCRLLWRDWNPTEQTMFVRNMKDPKRRDKCKTVALPTEAQAILLELAYAMNEAPETWADPQPRIFPFNAKTCSQRHTKAKKALGFDIRLHDNRRDCGSRLVERDGYAPAQAIMVTGHDTVHVFESTYLKQNVALFKNGPMGRREALQ